MARFHGLIGFAISSETSPGVWSETFAEKEYSGDIIRNTRRLVGSSTVHDSLVVNSIVSVVMDPYATTNFFAIRYAWWMGARWTVTNVDVQSPRLLLTLGDVYNG